MRQPRLNILIREDKKLTRKEKDQRLLERYQRIIYKQKCEAFYSQLEEMRRVANEE